MKQDQALSILVQAAHAGQKAGAFTLAEAKMIAEAIEVFFPKKADEVKEEVEK